MGNLKKAALALILGAAAQDAWAQNHDHSHEGHTLNGGTEFYLPVVKGDKTNVVPVDCDKLDRNGQVTPDFVKAMGNKSHLDALDNNFQLKGKILTDTDRVHSYLEHMQRHRHLRNLTRGRVEEAAKHCRDNYLDIE